MTKQQRQTIALLKRARKRIAQGWTQGAMARNTRGDVVDVEDTNACWFCMVGAVFAEKNRSHEQAAFDALRYRLPESGLAGWNDAKHRTRAHVLRRFDTAIKHLEAQ